MTYFDHNATSPMPDEVVDAMRPWWGVPANPSAAHRYGQAAAAALERARDEVARLLGVPSRGVVFTSGATEANHLGVRGAAALGFDQVAASAADHPSLVAAVRSAASAVWWAPLTPTGVWAAAPPGSVNAWAVQLAHHESGVLQDVPPRASHRWVHVDATQALGRLAVLPPADSVAVSAHKLGGPVGIGALGLRGGDAFPSLWGGGAQERGRRPGTVSVAGAVGFAAACRLAAQAWAERTQRWNAQRPRIEAAIRRAGGRVFDGAERVPNTLLAVFPGLEGEAVVQALDLRGIAISAGAACASGSAEPSAWLSAVGEVNVRGACRISLGPTTTDAEVDQLIGAIEPVIQALSQTEL